MSRTEWYFWGWVIWLMFGLVGVVLVMAPHRMGLVDPPSWPWLVGGFVVGLVVFVVLTVRKRPVEGHCLICYYRSGLRVLDDPGHRHISSYISSTRHVDKS